MIKGYLSLLLGLLGYIRQKWFWNILEWMCLIRCHWVDFYMLESSLWSLTTAQRCHQQRTRENSVIQQFSFSCAKLLAGLLNAWYLGDIWLWPVTHCPPLISQLRSRPIDKWVLYFTSVQRGQRTHTALYFSQGNGCVPSGSWEERWEQPTLALP